jgi:hypothetical protein
MVLAVAVHVNDFGSLDSSHGRSVAFQMAEVVVPRNLDASINATMVRG